MGFVDSWEQLSALERKASRKLDLDQQPANESRQSVEAFEPSAPAPSETNENFQAMPNCCYWSAFIASLEADVHLCPRTIIALVDCTLHLVTYKPQPSFVPLTCVGFVEVSFVSALEYAIAQVAIRVRPPLQRELEGYHPFQNTALVSANQRIVTVSENLQSTEDGGAAADAGLVSYSPTCKEAVTMTARPHKMHDPGWHGWGAGVFHLQVHL